MIARLRGELLEQELDRIVVNVKGVGYEVFVPQSLYAQLPSEGERVDLWIRQIVREDAWTLYGFQGPSQRRLFDLLREVKGCGPRISLALIGELGEETVITAIVNQVPKQLIKATGVGARMAERIIVELKDKLHQETLLHGIMLSDRRQVASKAGKIDPLIEALLALGYKRSEAEEAASEVEDTDGSLEDQLKFALNRLHQRGKR